MSDLNEKAIALHKKYRGKLATSSLIEINDHDDLSLAYTPGVAAVSLAIARNPELSFAFIIHQKAFGRNKEISFRRRFFR